MSQRFFLKKSSEYGALFHYFPGAIYEFRDHIWRVRDMQGVVTSDVFGSHAFMQLINTLRANHINVQSCTSPRQGTSEVFPMSWICSSCGRFLNGELASRNCPSCGQEMHQFPFLTVCDECGHIGPVTHMQCRHCNTSTPAVVWFDRTNAMTMRMVCKCCQDRVLRANRIQCNRHCSECRIRNKPCEQFKAEYIITSDLDPNRSCNFCSIPGQSGGAKRVTNATSNLISPVTMTTFDQDVPTIIRNATTSARRELQSRGLDIVSDRINRVFAITDVYLARIVVITATYGYRVGQCETVFPFPGGSVYLRADTVTAALFTFDASRLSDGNTHQTLHAAAHALLQTGGYISGLGREAYREYVDDANHAVLVFSTEGGGCDVLVREPAKLINWLRRSRAVVNGCKNQCQSGCTWCLYISNWQCSEFNHELNRSQLADLWREQFTIGDVNERFNATT